ncbi:hypothetical protein ALC60_01548 [Trachymyrmex zeteki]|uniref:Retrotransposon gag domain-containing protein n=1 Tax=Mycetomoellerius zeteki TaxID=64791 RepID=A0A151XGA0_9HYME|nr:hypothetical protein ALC60_01548 [Trachymyrmex zeteki]
MESTRQREAEIRQLREELHSVKQISPSTNKNIVTDAGDCGDVQLPERGGCAVGASERVECAANACERIESRASFRAVSSSGDGSVADVHGYVGPRAPRHTETGFRLKPDTFVGSAPLREFFVQFDLIAYANHWETGMKTAILVSCLRGKARAILENIQNLEDLEYTELKAKLELHFGEAHSLQNYYTQFTNRKQRFGESIAAFGSEIEKLARMAYPECSDLMRDKIACAQFVSTLSDGYVKRALQMEGVASLRLAIERAKAVQLIQGTCFKNKGENNFHLENRKRKNFNEGRDDSNEINKKGEDNKEKNGKTNKNGKFFKNKSEVKTGNRRECWECGKEGTSALSALVGRGRKT